MKSLTKKERLAVQHAVQALDPEGRFVDLDVENQTVHYSDEIIKHEEIFAFEGDEEIARAYQVAWLLTEGGYLPANVELEKRYSVGRPKAGAEGDILLTRPDGLPYAVIEVKAPGDYDASDDTFIKGQLFDVSLHEPESEVLCYTTIAVEEDETIRIVCIAIDRASYLSIEAWRESGSAGAPHIPANYGEARHVHYQKGSARDLRTTFTQTELDRLRKRLHNVLWRGSTPDNVVFGYVVKLLLAKIFDEKTCEVGKDYRFQLRYHGRTREDPKETFSRINELYEEAFRRYLSVDGDRRTDPLNDREFTPEQLAFVVELIQGLQLTSTNGRAGDLLGSFFEGITREGFKQSKGLFFTHANLTAFMLEMLAVRDFAIDKIRSNTNFADRLPRIIDPSCGSGTFLLTSMYLISRAIELARVDLSKNDDTRDFLDQMAPSSHPNRWARDFIYGIDITELIAMATKVNMVLHRDGSTHIFHADALRPLSDLEDQMLKGQSLGKAEHYSKPVSEAFDIVVTNPPFGIELPPATKRGLAKSFELATTNNPENLFLERWYQLLKPGGRLGAVLPESFFATRENLNARVFMFAHFNVRAVVSLPRAAFEPWTPTKTSLLFAQKKSRDEERAWLEDFRVARNERQAALDQAKKALNDLRKRLRALDSGAVSADRDESLELRDRLQKMRDAATQDEASQSPGGKASGSARRIDAAIEALVKVQEAMAEAETLGVALPALAFDQPVPDIIESSLRTSAGLRLIDVEVAATIEMLRTDESSFLVATVDEIGFKRTRRAEQARTNDLFCAVSPSGEEILNLNLTSDPWWVEISDDGDDLLAALKPESLWA